MSGVVQSKLCRGGGGNCDCEEYLPPANPGDRAVCQECEHGKSKHPPSANKDTVRSVFERIVESSANAETDGLSVAKKEVMSGYRPSSASTKAKAKKKDRKTSNDSTTSKSKAVTEKVAKTEKVASIVVMTGGIDRDQNELKGSQKVPSRTEFAFLEDQGCAAYSREGIAFDPDWTHEEVDIFLRELFPRPFQYADEHFKSDATSGRETRKKSIWLLLNKEGPNLRVLPGSRPSGKDLSRFKGRDHCATRDAAIYIALRCQIPKKIRQMWGGGNRSSPFPEDGDEREDEDGEDEDDEASERLTGPPGKNLKRRRSQSESSTSEVECIKTVPKKVKTSHLSHDRVQDRSESPGYDSPLFLRGGSEDILKPRVVPTDTASEGVSHKNIKNIENLADRPQRRVSGPPTTLEPLRYDWFITVPPFHNPWSEAYKISELDVEI